jgi:hypothetical protein
MLDIGIGIGERESSCFFLGELIGLDWEGEEDILVHLIYCVILY